VLTLTVVYDIVLDVNITVELSCALMRLDSFVSGTSVVGDGGRLTPACIARFIGRGVRHVVAFTHMSQHGLEAPFVRCTCMV